ncbi:hypothetical protein D6827_01120, partial [Candidatus Parcubacteria bacterium]
MNMAKYKKEELNFKSTYHGKKRIFFRFLVILLIFIAYLIFIVLKFGAAQGIYVSLLTWSFFVLCTPVADAGFLVDFPVRLLLKVKMIYSEVVIWAIAIGLNVYTLLTHDWVYDSTVVLSVFKLILLHPWPYWGVVLLSAAGTFVSIK